MKLSTWAKSQDLSYSTAYRLWKNGKLPCPSTQLETGTILVYPESSPITTTTFKNYTYCRVSSHAKKADLDRQVERCRIFCLANGWAIDKEVKEIASGLNDKRKKLTNILNNPPTKLIVEHKDRLTRFGFNYIEVLLNKLGCQVIVINRDVEEEDDLMKDMIAIITSFCCRLYGLRRGLRKKKELEKVVVRDD